MKTLQRTCDFGPPSPGDTLAVGRADRVVQELTALSRGAVRGLFDQGCVSVNNQPCTRPQTSLQTGDRVQVRYDPHRRYKESAKRKPAPAFDSIYEDEHLMVVNKSPHVFTVPAKTDKGKTLVAALEQHITREVQRSRNRPAHVHIVQRLDRGVSGVLVAAKSAKIAADLREQFASRKPKRQYIAIVSGEIEQRQGTIRSHMATAKNLNRYSTDKPGQGELAITHYQVIARPRGATALQVRLETGRRNQIRVHFAEAGHPVLGDKRYRPDLSVHPKWKARRLALHAATLEFVHPVTGKAMQFESPLPREFQPFMR